MFNIGKQTETARLVARIALVLLAASQTGCATADVPVDRDSDTVEDEPSVLVLDLGADARDVPSSDGSTDVPGDRAADRTLDESRIPPVTNPYVISIDEPVPDLRGGIFVHDLDGDGHLDFLVTSATHVSAYEHDGRRMWVVDAGIATSGNYPGTHHPGAVAGDLDRDDAQEVAYLLEGGVLLILDGATGVEEARYPFEGAQALAVADLEGLGETHGVLQLSQTELVAIRFDTGAEQWRTDEYIGVEHSPVRLADLDADGRDEVAGLTFIDDDGSLMTAWDLEAERGTNLWNVDSIVIADVVPDGIPEVVLAEQGGNNELIVANEAAVLFGWANPDNPCCDVADECIEDDCDTVAVGDFGSAPGLEILCGSACGQAPWVFDSAGSIVAQWSVPDTAPESWTSAGIEEVSGIDWDGSLPHEIVAKERHADADAAIIDPMTGSFIARFPGRAARVYAVDVVGDSREEVVTLDAGGEIRVYWNDAPAPADLGPSPWTDPLYRRQKQNWNYYSP